MGAALLDCALFAGGAAVLAAAVRWWRPELPRRWAAGHALLAFAFFAVPLATPLVQVPVDIVYHWRPWSETLTGPPEVDNPLLTDIPLQMLPFRTLVRERLLDLEAPLWAHELGTGQPLLGNAQSAPFAPLHLGALPLPPLRGLTVAAAWQVLLGLLLTHALVLALARTSGRGSDRASGPASGRAPGEPPEAAGWRLQAGAATGAAGFALSAYSVAWLYHPLAMVAMWIPGVVLGIVALHRGERGAFPGLVASALGLAVSGHPETAAHTALLAAGLGAVLWLRGPAVGRPRFALRAGGAALLAACLAAPALLPVLEVLPASQRRVALRSGAERGNDPPDLRPAVFLPLVDPLAFGSPRDGDWSAPDNFNERCTHYAGGAALAAALAGAVGLGWGRRKPARRAAPGSGRVAGILLAGVLALLAAVKAPPVFRLVDALPVLGDAAHGRLRVFWVLAVALAAGLAAPRLAERPGARWAGVAALVGAGVVLALVPPPFGSAHQRTWWWVTLLGLAAAAAALAVPRLRPAFPAVLLAAVVADLFTLGVRYHALVPPGRQLEPPPALAWLIERRAEAEAPFRVLAEEAQMPANLAALHGLRDPRSEDPMAPHASSWLVGKRLSAGRWRPGRPVFLWPPYDLPALRMLGVRHVLAAHGRRLGPPWEPAFDGVGGRIWRLPDPLPPFFVPARARAVRSPELARELTLRNRDFAGLVVHADPDAPPGFQEPTPQEGRVWLRELSANGFDLAVESRTGAVVASSVSRVPGWRAAIDGWPAEPVTVNWAFLGVRVPPGVHRVELDYAPAGWRWGLGLFWGAVAACLGMGLARRLRRAAPRVAGSGAP